ncbi:MAG: hypothetical protein AAGJ52_10595, partial [Pseudomonadota bacterium]
MDLGTQKRELDDRQVDALSLHKDFFFSSPLQSASDYLIGLEGQAIAESLAREEEKFMLLFSSDSGAVRHLKSAAKAEAISLMRELIGYYRDKFKAADPSAFNLRPGVARLSRFLQPIGVVAALRDLYHFLSGGLEPAQRQLWYQVTREVTSDCDRFSVRSTFRGDIDLIKTLISGSELDEHPHRDDIEAALYRWVQGWAKLPLLPRISDDFTFLAFFCECLTELPELQEDDFKRLIVGLSDAAVNRGVRAISDNRFELLRAFARSSRRVSFCQFLLKQHGRSLDLLGDSLKAWLLVDILVGDSPEFARQFRYSLKLQVIAQEIDLGSDELESFVNSIIAKASPFRERYELDWLTSSARTLISMIDAEHRLSPIGLEANSSIKALASQVSSESKTKVSSGEIHALLMQMARILKQSFAVSLSSEEAVEVFIEGFAPLVGTRHSHFAFRNLSRLCVLLAEIVSREWPQGEGRFRAMAKTMSQMRLPAIAEEVLTGSKIAALGLHELIFVSEANLAISRPSQNEIELGICDFLRNESAQGRMSREELLGLSNDPGSSIFWTRHVSSETVTALTRCLDEVGKTVVLLEDHKPDQDNTLETQVNNAARISEISKYFYLLAGHRINRIEEEFQTWIAPKLRSLVGQFSAAELDSWSVSQASLLDALPNVVSRRLTSQVYRTTGVRSGGSRSVNGLPRFD